MGVLALLGTRVKRSIKSCVQCHSLTIQNKKKKDFHLQISKTVFVIVSWEINMQKGEVFLAVLAC